MYALLVVVHVCICQPWPCMGPLSTSLYSPAAWHTVVATPLGYGVYRNAPICGHCVAKIWLEDLSYNSYMYMHIYIERKSH